MDISEVNEAFSGIVDRLTRRHLELWFTAPVTLSGFTRRFSPRQKAEKEGEIERLLRNGANPLGRYEEMDGKERARYVGLAHAAIAKLVSAPGDTVSRRFFDDCEVAGRSFVRQAREFDPSLSDREIHQALRNQWVFNSIQSYLAHPVSLTPSSLAYSLMYPYTDNWLDEGVSGASEREEFLRSLEDCLEGRDLALSHPGIRTFGKLLQMIEGEYNRGEFPLVFRSLSAIHHAQAMSLVLHNTPKDATEESLQGITVKKGGTSVLVDGFLVRGTLTEDQMATMFGYGTVLQFIDDLQDIDEDSEAGHSTAFLRALEKGPLDGITTRLINYTHTTVSAMSGEGTNGRSALCRLIEESCTFLIWEAIARHRRLYSDGFLQAVEGLIPLRLSYLGGLHLRLKSRLQADRPAPAFT